MNIRSYLYPAQILLLMLVLSLPASAENTRPLMRIAGMTMTSPAEYGLSYSSLTMEYNKESQLQKISSFSSDHEGFNWEILYEEM